MNKDKEMTEAERIALREYPVKEGQYGEDENRFERAAFLDGLKFKSKEPVQQSDAVEFAEWKDKNYNRIINSDEGFDYYANADGHKSFADVRYFTLTELYKLFKDGK